MDLPGRGESSAFELYSVDLFVESLATALKHYDFTNFSIVGHSMGGQLAITCFSHNLISPLNPTKVVAFTPSGISLRGSCSQSLIKCGLFSCMSDDSVYD